MQNADHPPCGCEGYRRGWGNPAPGKHPTAEKLPPLPGASRGPCPSCLFSWRQHLTAFGFGLPGKCPPATPRGGLSAETYIHTQTHTHTTAPPLSFLVTTHSPQAFNPSSLLLGRSPSTTDLHPPNAIHSKQPRAPLKCTSRHTSWAEALISEVPGQPSQCPTPAICEPHLSLSPIL